MSIDDDAAQSSPAAKAAPPAAKPIGAQEAKKEGDAFIAAIRENDDVISPEERTKNPNLAPSATLHAAAFQYLVDSGQLVKMGDGDSYVVPGVGDARFGGKSVLDENGQALGMLQNEASHVWTPDYVQKHILSSDADIAIGARVPEGFHPQHEGSQQDYAALLKHARETLHRDGNDDVRLILSTAESASAVYSAQSREGHKYLIVSEDALKKGLGKPEEMQALRRAIDTESASIKNGGISTGAYIQKHEYDLARAQLVVPNGTTQLPFGGLLVKDGALDLLVKNKDFIPIARGDVDPAQLEALRGTDGKPLPPGTPVYLVSGANADFKGTSWGAQAAVTDTGKPFIIVDEKSHLWNEDYVRRHVMASDADVAAFVKDKTLVPFDQYKPPAAEAADYRAISIRMQEKAEEDGTPMPKILINRDPTASDLVSFQTAEGKEYVYISEKYLKETLAHPNKATELEGRLEEVQNDIKNGKHGPAGLIADHNDRVGAEEAASFERSTTSGDGSRFLPGGVTPIDLNDSALDQMTASGTLVKVARSDVDPSVLEVKDRDGKPMPPDAPIYVIPNANSDYAAAGEPFAAYTAEGKPYILIDESKHIWTEDYVKNHVNQMTDQGVKEDIENKALSKPEDVLEDLHKKLHDGPAFDAAKRRYEGIMDAVRKDSENAVPPVHPVPKVLIENDPKTHYASVGAAASVSKEGTSYIFINREYFEAALLTDDPSKAKGAPKADDRTTAIIGIIGHEISHISDGDVYAAGQARGHNIEAARHAEMLADLKGFGPVNGGDPLAGAAYFEGFMRDSYQRQNPESKIPRDQITDGQMKEASQKDVDAKSDIFHPSDWERVLALREESRLMTLYEKEHKRPPLSDEQATINYNQKESDAIIPKVFDYIKDKKLVPRPGADKAPAPAAPGPIAPPPPAPQAAAPSPAHEEALQAVRSAMGNQTIIPSDDAPSAPASSPGAAQAAAIDALRNAMGQQKGAHVESVPTAATLSLPAALPETTAARAL